MPRPCKRRRICSMPSTASWMPAEADAFDKEAVILLLEEYETIRLIDWQGLTQEECALRMGVARATVQAVYSSARKKLAESLVLGRPFRIEGGDYALCQMKGQCGWHSPHLSRCGQQEQKHLSDSEMKKERGKKMRVAVTYENGQVFQHFGHTKEFKIYDVEDGAVKSSEVVNTNGSGHGALSTFLTDHKVQALICGGIGGGARTALADAGIELYPGVNGNADTCVAEFIAGKLKFDPDVVCSHHHEGGHDCGENKHSCSGN